MDTTKEVTSSTNPDYAGLQVAGGRSSVAPPWNTYTRPNVAPNRPRTYCGLARSTFLLALTLVVVIIAAAVGGGVGGTLAVRNARK